MKRIAFALAFAAALFSCAPKADYSGVPEASSSQVTRVEPLSWWVGMTTPLQLMVQGPEISAYDVAVEGSGLKVKAVHKADSPNFVFLDMEVRKAGEYNLVFTRGEDSFKYPYTVSERAAGSRERLSYTTADMIYLIMPDRFASATSENDTMGMPDVVDRKDPVARHGGDLQGIIDHLDYIADLGATAI